MCRSSQPAEQLQCRTLPGLVGAAVPSFSDSWMTIVTVGRPNSARGAGPSTSVRSPQSRCLRGRRPGSRGPRAGVLLLGIGLALFLEAAVPHAGSPHKVPVTLNVQELVKLSDRVVLGVVRRVQQTTKVKTSRSGRAVRLPVQVTALEVEALYGAPFERQLVVHEFGPLATKVAEGASVIWFLKATNEAGFDSPVGDRAGDFRVSRDGTGRRFAISALSNRGLWHKERSFWDSFDQQFTNATKHSLRLHWAPVAADVIEAVNKPCSPTAVPLELLLAAASTKAAH